MKKAPIRYLLAIFTTVLPLFAQQDVSLTLDMSAAGGPSLSKTTEVTQFVSIPAGTFQMGCLHGTVFDKINEDEFPVHAVSVGTFFIEKYEVTKAQWDEVYNWAISHDYSFDNAGSAMGTNHPVHSVNWYDAVKWCNARSEKEGRTPCYTYRGNVYRKRQREPDCNWRAEGYRLPTEAEWEYVCRAGLTRDEATAVESMIRKDLDSDREATYPVGEKQPNSWGLYDMRGNVREWCWDWYNISYYHNSSSVNPRGPSSGTYRAIRGGSWKFILIRPSFYSSREGRCPDYTDDNLGFRVVLNLSQ